MYYGFIGGLQKAIRQISASAVRDRNTEKVETKLNIELKEMLNDFAKNDNKFGIGLCYGVFLRGVLCGYFGKRQ